MIRQPLSPLRVEARNSAVHVPRCILPRPQEHWCDVRPVPLSARTVRELAYTQAERMVLQRLKRLEKLMTPAAANGERATSPSAVVLPLRAPPVLHTRTFAVQLPPMALDVPPQPPVAQPTAAGQTLVGNAALEASGLAGGIHRPFSDESPSSIRPPANREMRMRRRSDPGAE